MPVLLHQRTINAANPHPSSSSELLTSAEQYEYCLQGLLGEQKRTKYKINGTATTAIEKSVRVLVRGGTQIPPADTYIQGALRAGHKCFVFTVSVAARVLGSEREYCTVRVQYASNHRAPYEYEYCTSTLD